MSTPTALRVSGDFLGEILWFVHVILYTIVVADLAI